MQAVAFRSDDGQAIYIETSEAIEVAHTNLSGGTIAGGAEEILMKLQDVGEVIADVCSTLQQHIHAKLGEAKPKELTLEFAVKLAGEAGVPLVSKGTAEGTFKVTAKWEFDDK